MRGRGSRSEYVDELLDEHLEIKRLITKGKHTVARERLLTLETKVNQLGDDGWTLDIDRDFGRIQYGEQDYFAALDTFGSVREQALRYAAIDDEWSCDAAYTLSWIAFTDLALGSVDDSFELFRAADSVLILAGSDRHLEALHLELMLQHPMSKWIRFTLSKRLMRLGRMLGDWGFFYSGAKAYVKM